MEVFNVNNITNMLTVVNICQIALSFNVCAITCHCFISLCKYLNKWNISIHK